MTNTRNEVTLRGYVGNYVRMPKRRGDPARFDLLTIERGRKEGTGELITDKNWHTCKTWEFIEFKEKVHTGAWIEVRGRIDTRMADGTKVVEVVVDSIDVLLTQEQRDTLQEAEDRP